MKWIGLNKSLFKLQFRWSPSIFFESIRVSFYIVPLEKGPYDWKFNYDGL